MAAHIGKPSNLGHYLLLEVGLTAWVPKGKLSPVFKALQKALLNNCDGPN